MKNTIRRLSPMSQRQSPPKLNLDQARTQLQQCHALAPT